MVTDEVRQGEAEGLPLLEPERLPLEDTETLLVDETVEDRHSVGVALPE